MKCRVAACATALEHPINLSPLFTDSPSSNQSRTARHATIHRRIHLLSRHLYIGLKAQELPSHLLRLYSTCRCCQQWESCHDAIKYSASCPSNTSISQLELILATYSFRTSMAVSHFVCWQHPRAVDVRTVPAVASAS